jgi:hypothetical protein
MTPEYGEDAPEREIKEHDREDRELEYLDPEDNEAHAPGQVCVRCGAVITAGQDARLRAAAAREHASARQRVTSASEISAVARRAGSEVAPGAGRARPAPDEGPHLGPPRRHPCGRGLRQGLGRVSVAGLVCLRPDARGRLFYRVRIHRRRTGERRGMSEADYAGLMAAAHH